MGTPSVDIAALLQDFSTKLDRLSEENRELRSEIEQQRSAIPRTRPSDRTDLHNAGAKRRQVANAIQRGDLREIEPGGGGTQLPIDHRGHAIPKHMLAEMGAQFETGDLVRINPDATREGFGGDQRWENILEKVGSDGYGTVDRVLWYAKGGYWKYKVKVPGLTGKSADGFYEYELLAA